MHKLNPEDFSKTLFSLNLIIREPEAVYTFVVHSVFKINQSSIINNVSINSSKDIICAVIFFYI